MGFPFSILIIQMLLWTLLLVADWCSGLHAESILTPGLPITSVSLNDDEEGVMSSSKKHPGESCDFKTHCPWISSSSMDGKPHWVQIVFGELTPQQQERLLEDKPTAGKLDDGILYLNTSQIQSQEACVLSQLRSPLYPKSSRICQLDLSLYSTEESAAQTLMVTMHEKNHSVTLPPLKDIALGNRSHWKLLSTNIGEIDGPFHITLSYTYCTQKAESFIILNSVRLRNCFDDHEEDLSTCPWDSSFRCDNGECIGQVQVCDFQTDCSRGDDEGSVCEKILPQGAHCTFEKGTCGWTVNVTGGQQWKHTSSGQINRGDNVHLGDIEGNFLYLLVDTGHNDSFASVHSDSLPPVVAEKACQFTFKFLVYGNFNGSLAVFAHEENTMKSSKLWQVEGTHSAWSTATVTIPQYNNRFHVQLLATWGWNSLSHMIVDNVTFSADCFHSGRIEISSEEQDGSHEIDPWEDDILSPLSEPMYTEDEEEIFWIFSSCGARGPIGPTQTQCNNAYRNKNISVVVGKDGPLKGVQMWKVPFTKVYTISAYGAAGGKGAKNHNKRYHGIFMSGVFHLEKDELLYILVGQQGEDACPGNNKTQEICMGESSIIEDEYGEKKTLSEWAGGGGGGGGATYIFKEVNGVFIPLLVGAGGGGKAYLEDPYDSSDFEQLETYERNMAVPGLNGQSGAAGGGGGWNDITQLLWAGKSLIEGAEGGQSCYKARASLQWDTHGGFGGGGGPCTSGGGGGGYKGGDASQLDDISADGQDGVSFINPSGEMFLQPLAAMENDGEVRIEMFLNCSHCKSGNCKKDAERRVVCLCEHGTMLGSDNVTCIGPKGPIPERQLSLPLILAVLIATVILGVIFACGSLSFVYHRKKKQLEGARVRLQSTEYKLSKIRSSIIMTDYNPNYCFAGKGAGLSELKEVPRKNITLLRALGHGAFGEVYEGLVVGISGDPNPLQVAIKTLPEICSEQDEMDFLMEALIISKFSHQNIVRCIGVSLQTLPRFILLELMSGGDMKTFLRQNRPLVNQLTSLTMTDLLNMARDIACGCKYLEDNHFIHRDIAARNCLLTFSGTGRVAKIGDFGMARDIYRASYYRKGGRAMLPVKWMPPEAFLEGIFTSKTDTWSFGVLLWEIFSLGYMPYPCKTNQEVLEFVTSGGRMDPPKNCPGPVYRIMTQCWQHTPDHRPNFSTILERIIYCTQDPDVINTELPVESGPPPEDEGSTIMRPSSCNGMTPLVGNTSLPPLLDTQTTENKLGDLPQELLVENLVGWNISHPGLPCVTEAPESSWVQPNPNPTTETKSQMTHKLKNKSKNLWNPTYGSWVMESTC
ncbi:leukocyte tyrosine kinase receptor isoform X1 [Hyla sarda]|uniref:leukocyte tyrosine kinase receptor isoform X1 n=2 Tax=Hyla sarda TaxID=327740 RepID=UPI0024C2DC83|nr:leukocyte tyrosine kinase receptor isoform X1 [Hyla sarda]